MVAPVTLIVFSGIALVIALTPGPDMMFCIARGAEGGRRAAVLAALGLLLGPLAGVAIAALGIATLSEHVPGALDVIRWLGAGYLLWLAWQSLRRPSRRTGAEPSAGRQIGAGIFVGLTNPQGAGVVLTLLPQFIDPARNVFTQSLVLGLVLSLTAFFVNATFGLLAANARVAVLSRPMFARALRLLSAGIFGALALRLVAGHRA